MASTELVRSAFDYDEKIGRLRWKLTGKLAGGVGANGYVEIGFHRKNWKSHRLVWLWHGRDLPEFLDHIDGDPLNGRVENLRAATKAQNMHNMKRTARNKCGVKGVFYDPLTGKWRARLMTHRKIVELGRHEDLEFAELVITMAREKYHGAFARHV